MSAETLAWAIRCKIAKASVKNLLMVVADLANHVTGEVFPSIGYLQEATGLSKPTVLSALNELVELQILERTEDRRGRTMQIPVYLFHMADSVPMVPRPGPFRTGEKIDPLSKGVKKPSETGQVFSGKEVKNLTTEPSIGNQVEDSPPSPNGEATPTNDLTLFDDADEAPPEARPPIEEFVLDEWHALKAEQPGIADIAALDSARKKKIRARAAAFVAEAAKGKNPIGIAPEDVWAQIFLRIRRSTFLCGRAPPGRGRATPFKLTIDFVLRPAEFLKILEGAYDDDERYRNTRGFDDAGRQYGSAEQATRGALQRLHAADWG